MSLASNTSDGQMTHCTVHKPWNLSQTPSLFANREEFGSTVFQTTMVCEHTLEKQLPSQKEQNRKNQGIMGDYCAPARGTMEIMRPEGHIMPPEGCIMLPEGCRRPAAEMKGDDFLPDFVKCSGKSSTHQNLISPHCILSMYLSFNVT